MIARFAAAAGIAALMSAAAAAEVCRSMSASWTDASGEPHRTLMHTRADDGCKRITHLRASLTGPDMMNHHLGIEGNDCDCDLVADGQEAMFSAPPELQARSLLRICEGPEADPSTYRDS